MDSLIFREALALADQFANAREYGEQLCASELLCAYTCIFRLLFHACVRVSCVWRWGLQPNARRWGHGSSECDFMLKERELYHSKGRHMGNS